MRRSFRPVWLIAAKQLSSAVERHLRQSFFSWFGAHGSGFRQPSPRFARILGGATAIVQHHRQADHGIGDSLFGKFTRSETRETVTPSQINSLAENRRSLYRRCGDDQSGRHGICFEFDTGGIFGDIPIMAQQVTIAKHDKRKRLVLPDDFVVEAPYGEYIIREGKGRLAIVAIPPPRIRRTYKATPALERKLSEAKDAKELDCPPDFFTEPLGD